MHCEGRSLKITCGGLETRTFLDNVPEGGSPAPPPPPPPVCGLDSGPRFPRGRCGSCHPVRRRRPRRPVGGAAPRARLRLPGSWRGNRGRGCTAAAGRWPESRAVGGSVAALTAGSPRRALHSGGPAPTGSRGQKQEVGRVEPGPRGNEPGTGLLAMCAGAAPRGWDLGCPVPRPRAPPQPPGAGPWAAALEGPGRSLPSQVRTGRRGRGLLPLGCRGALSQRPETLRPKGQNGVSSLVSAGAVHCRWRSFCPEASAAKAGVTR